jgi:hypothetical protein
VGGAPSCPPEHATWHSMASMFPSPIFHGESSHALRSLIFVHPKKIQPQTGHTMPPLPAPKLQGVWSTYCRLKSSHPKDHVLPETSSTHQSTPHARMTRGENVWCPGSAPPLVAHLQVHLQATCRPTCSVCEVVPAPNPTPSTRVFTHINHPTSAWPSLTTKHTMKQGFRPRPSIWP